MKYEWRKHDKEIYGTKAKPTIVALKPITYITIEGVGNPNDEAFKERIQALYAFSYTVRMAPKKGVFHEGYYEYVVFPLEGEWTSTQSYESISGEGLDKDQLVYKIMIRQPDFITEAIFVWACDAIKAKVPDALRMGLKLETIDEGRVVQMLHNGSYDTEQETFAQMKAFIEKENLEYVDTSFHKEIYLSMSKDDSSKNKTLLRYRIK